MLIVSGYNVFPREVEEVLHLNPEVREAAVVAKTDDYRGELPVAFIVAGKREARDGEALQRYCAERLAGLQDPRRISLCGQPAQDCGRQSR